MPSGILVREQRRQRKEQKRLLKLKRCGAIKVVCQRAAALQLSYPVSLLGKAGEQEISAGFCAV